MELTLLIATQHQGTDLWGYQSDFSIESDVGIGEGQRLSDLLEAAGIERSWQDRWEWTIRRSHPLPLLAADDTDGGLWPGDDETADNIGVELDMELSELLSGGTVIYGEIPTEKDRTWPKCDTEHLEVILKPICGSELAQYVSSRLLGGRRVKITEVLRQHSKSLKALQLRFGMGGYTWNREVVGSDRNNVWGYNAIRATTYQVSDQDHGEGQDQGQIVKVRATLAAGLGDCTESVLLSDGHWRLSGFDTDVNDLCEQADGNSDVDLDGCHSGVDRAGCHNDVGRDGCHSVDLVVSAQDLKPTALQFGTPVPSVLALEPDRVQQGLNSLVVHRALRSVRSSEPALQVPSSAPEPVKRPPSFSWAMLLIPIAVAALLAWLFQPLYAIFALIGAVGVLGRQIESYWRYRKDKKRYRRETQEYEAAKRQALAVFTRDSETYRWLRQPNVAELYRVAQGRESLWERRLGDNDALVVTLGVGFDHIEQIGEHTGELLASLDMGLVTHLHTLDPTGLGLYGQRENCLALMRSVICQLATLHGPSELSFEFLVADTSGFDCGVVGSDIGHTASQGSSDPDGCASGASCANGDLGAGEIGAGGGFAAAVCDFDLRPWCWEWVKWFPHSAELFDLERLHTPKANNRPHIGDQSSDRTASHCVVLVVDDIDADVAAATRYHQSLGYNTVVLAIAQRFQDLPRDCGTQYRLDGVVLHPRDGISGNGPCVSSGISHIRALDWARRLSPFIDPEAETDNSARSRTSVSLFDVVELAQDLTSETLDVYEPMWASSQLSKVDSDSVISDTHSGGGNKTDGGLKIVLGTTADELLEVDFAADGPHMLIAGMTGSGKSDFLRALITGLAHRYGPDELMFLLADFKGGGTMDSCAELAHCAGVITDLEPTQVDRAIASITRELTRREQLLRDHQVRDYEQAKPLLDEPLPRLMVIIDEFAVLAGEYQTCLDNIVDLAARGRSLGMHLILATQHPSGVVNAKLRANTNMCLTFRTRSKADSVDVIGVGDAADISHRRPGEAYLVLGNQQPQLFRATACNSRRSVGNIAALEVEPFYLNPTLSPGVIETVKTESNTVEPGVEIVDEHDLLTRAIIGYGKRLGLKAEQLWFEPLTTKLNWEYFNQRLNTEIENTEGDIKTAGVELSLGLYDRHSTSEVPVLRWSCESGAIAFYVSSNSCSRKVIESLIAISAQTQITSTCNAETVGDIETTNNAEGYIGEVYVISAAGGRYDEIWPHVLNVIDVGDSERITRLLRRLEQPPNPQTGMRLVIIDDIASLERVDDPIASAQIFDRLDRIAANSAQNKVALAISASAVTRIPTKIGHSISTRLLMSLSDPNGGLILGIGQAKHQNLEPMRAIDIGVDRAVQLVEPPSGDTLQKLIEQVKTPVTEPISVLPETVTLTQLSEYELCDSPPSHSHKEAAPLSIPIGITASKLTRQQLSLKTICKYSGADIGVCTLIIGPDNREREYLISHIASGYLQEIYTSTDELQAELAKRFRSADLEIEDDVLIVSDCDRLDQRSRQRLRDILDSGDNFSAVIALTSDMYSSLTSPITPVRNTAQIIALGSPRDYPVLSSQYRQNNSGVKVSLNNNRARGYLRKVGDSDSGCVEIVQYVQDNQNLGPDTGTVSMSNGGHENDVKRIAA